MIGIAGLQRLIPHRGPMLLVDRVLEVVPGERAVVHKAVSHGELWYRALAPDAPEEAYAYPHALLLESFNQACAVLVMATWARPTTDVVDDGVPMLGSYSNLGFGRPVLPGDTIEHRVRVSRVMDDAMVLEGESTVDGEIVLTAERGLVVRRPAATMLAKAADRHG